MYFIKDYPTAHAFLVRCSSDKAINQQIIKIYGDSLQKIEARLDKAIVIQKDTDGNQVGIGTQRPIEEYILTTDVKAFLELATKEGVVEAELPFLAGNMYSNLMNVILTRVLPTLASKRMPPSDPSGMFANLFNGKMPEA